MSTAMIEPLEDRRLCSAGVQVLATLGSTAAPRYSDAGLVVDAATGTAYGTDRATAGDTPAEVFAVSVGATAGTTLATFPADFAGDGVTNATPTGRLVRDAAGDLFGLTAANGGPGAVGVLWELPAGAATPLVLHRFDNPYAPASLSADAAGNLYGSALTIGGGSVWWQYPADGSGFRQLTPTGGPDASTLVEADPAGDLFGVTSAAIYRRTTVPLLLLPPYRFRSHVTELTAAAVAVAAAAPGQPATPARLTRDRVTKDLPIGLAVDAARTVYVTRPTGIDVRRPGQRDLRTLAKVPTGLDTTIVSNPTIDGAGRVFALTGEAHGDRGRGTAVAVAARTRRLKAIVSVPVPTAFTAAAATLVPDAAGDLYGIGYENQTAVLYRLTGSGEVAG